MFNFPKLILLVLVLIFIAPSLAFIPFKSSNSRSRDQALFNQAKKATDTKGKVNELQPKSNTEAGAINAWVNERPEPKTARERVSFKNKIPFSDDMYETLKKTIEMLSKRARTDPPPEPLTVEEAKWFAKSIETILADAKMYGPPARPERSAAAPPSA